MKYCPKGHCQAIRYEKRKSAKNRDNRKPAMMLGRVKVTCLNCDEEFMSLSKYYRTCPRCKKILEDKMEWPY